MSEKPLRLAVDIGGTFVDAIELDTATGELRFRKASTTPRKPSDGVLDAVAALRTPLERTALFIHGTTLGLNAVLERRGAKVGIITNDGFRDIFLVGRANVPDAHMYDFHYARPEPLVRRHRIAGVQGRLDYRGRVVDELDETGVADAARRLVEEHRSRRLPSVFCSPSSTRAMNAAPGRSSGNPFRRRESRYRATSRASTASTSAPAPRSSTPISARSSSATSTISSGVFGNARSTDGSSSCAPGAGP